MKRSFVHSVCRAAPYGLTHSLVHELCRTLELIGILDFTCFCHILDYFPGILHSSLNCKLRKDWDNIFSFNTGFCACGSPPNSWVSFPFHPPKKKIRSSTGAEGDPLSSTSCSSSQRLRSRGPSAALSSPSAAPLLSSRQGSLPGPGTRDSTSQTTLTLESRCTQWSLPGSEGWD